jgi:AmmeMemoRadiSam system protein B
MALHSAYPLVREDPVAHAREHSLEVQLPFLQRLGASFQIVPLGLGVVPYEVCQEIAHAIAHTVRRINRAVVVVVSSDMTHCRHEYRCLHQRE